MTRSKKETYNTLLSETKEIALELEKIKNSVTEITDLIRLNPSMGSSFKEGMEDTYINELDKLKIRRDIIEKSAEEFLDGHRLRTLKKDLTKIIDRLDIINVKEDLETLKMCRTLGRSK